VTTSVSSTAATPACAPRTSATPRARPAATTRAARNASATRIAAPRNHRPAALAAPTSGSIPAAVVAWRGGRLVRIGLWCRRRSRPRQRPHLCRQWREAAGQLCWRIRSM
jgi:hypothetical protein